MFNDPSKRAAGEYRYRCDFDIDSTNSFCEGYLGLKTSGENSDLIVEINGAKIVSFSMNDLKELNILNNDGACLVEAVSKDDTHYRLCRFTPSYGVQVSEFVKVCNYYLKTGEFTEMKIMDTKCPKCGERYLPGTNICPKCINKKQQFKWLLLTGRKYFKYFIFAGILVLIAEATALIIPYLNKLLVDGYLTSNGVFPKTAVPPVAAVIILVSLILVINVFRLFFKIMPSLIRLKYGIRYIQELRCTIFNKIERLSLSSINTHGAGEMIKRTLDDTSTVSKFIEGNLLWFVSTGSLFFGVLLYFLFTRPLMAIMILLPMPLILFIVSRIKNKIRSRYERQWILGAHSRNILHDIFKGIRVVKVFGTEKREIEKYAEADRDLVDIQIKNEKMWAVLIPFLSFLIGTGELLVLAYGASAVLGTNIFGDRMTIGELTQCITYIGYIYTPLQSIIEWPKQIAEVTTSIAKINFILNEDEKIKEADEPVSLDIKGNIRFDNVTFGYSQYEPVLKNLDLDIKEGEMIGLVGHSGVGKSTLINLVMRLYDINEGSLTIDGVDVRKISKSCLANSIGTVFQETFLFSGTIYDNIVYASPDATYEDVLKAAKLSKAHDFIIKLPDAYNTVIGENGHTLSGGERQRIAIARAILKKPSILILDEATSSLDTETEKDIQNAIQEITKTCTTIAIAHRLSTLRNATRIAVLEGGKIVEIGTHDELLARKGIYHDLVMTQKMTNKMQ